MTFWFHGTCNLKDSNLEPQAWQKNALCFKNSEKKIEFKVSKNIFRHLYDWKGPKHSAKAQKSSQKFKIETPWPLQDLFYSRNFNFLINILDMHNSVMMIVEFHSEADKIHTVFASQWAPSKDFLISCKKIWGRLVKILTFSVFKVNFLVQKLT